MLREVDMEVLHSCEAKRLYKLVALQQLCNTAMLGSVGLQGCCRAKSLQGLVGLQQLCSPTEPVTPSRTPLHHHPTLPPLTASITPTPGPADP